jgi:hypothetical protein
MFKDPKTTWTGLLTGIVGVFAYYDVIGQQIAVPLLSIGSMLVGIFAGDSKKN